MPLNEESKRALIILQFLSSKGGSVSHQEFNKWDVAQSPKTHLATHLEKLIGDNYVNDDGSTYRLTDHGRSRLDELNRFDNDPDTWA